MNRHLNGLALGLSILLIVGCAALGAAPRQSDTPVNPRAKILAEFTSRIDSYLELHRKLEGKAPMEETRAPAEIAAAEKGLAARIRAARPQAKPGDIFTPEVRAEFRRLLRPEMKGTDGRENRSTILDEGNPGAMKLKVNQDYPQDEPLSTMPPDVLAGLPKLPEELEYRFVGKHLILRDVHANLIVDFIPNAIA
jgi:hypothetical protein